MLGSIREHWVMESQLSSRTMTPSVDTMMTVVMMMIRTLKSTDYRVGAKHCAKYRYLIKYLNYIVIHFIYIKIICNL